MPQNLKLEVVGYNIAIPKFKALCMQEDKEFFNQDEEDEE